MVWVKLSCSQKLRLALDILEILCCNLIHLGMEGFDLTEMRDGNYRSGEMIWNVVVITLGILGQIVLLIKILGCTLSSHCLRTYYGTCSLVLWGVSATVFTFNYMHPAGPSSLCDNSTNSSSSIDCKMVEAFGGPVKTSKFTAEFGLFVFTAITGFLYFYSFILACCFGKKERVEPQPKERGDEGMGFSTSDSASAPLPSAPLYSFD